MNFEQQIHKVDDKFLLLFSIEWILYSNSKVYFENVFVHINA
jgi:hypothetical protein